MKNKHEHPLTLIKNGGELVCPECHEHYLDEFYNCNTCRLHVYCKLCGERLSGICYTCTLCCLLVHQSCFELPEEIQITYSPHCLLHFEDESDKSMWPKCDFCEQRGIQYKYCCGDCGFQICVGCASKLIKYHHQGQQHVEHFSHRHPLTLLNLDDMSCMFCLKSIDGLGPAYGCAPCEFFIHSSCCDISLPVIEHACHPQHSLTLQDYIVNGKTRNLCNACRRQMQGLGYRCAKCEFDLHAKCATLKPNIKYKGHEHLLILVEDLSQERECAACGFEIRGVFFMHCVVCFLDYHLECGSSDHKLPPTVWHNEHEHPLIPTTESLVKDDSHFLYCNACGEERKAEDPFYHCAEPECEYFAHVRCIITEVEFDDKGKLMHFDHDHVLILRDIHKNDNICCNGCRKGVQGPAYGCDPCKYYLHKSCAELPRQIYGHQSHRHYLTHRGSYFSKYRVFCNTCDKRINGFVYRCGPCNFDLDLDCASLHPSVNLTVSTNECTVYEGQERIGHFSHGHHLIILDVAAGGHCKLCYKKIIGQCYGCAQCDFYIHRSCSALLQEIRSPLHPLHSLKLSVAKGPRCCDACLFDIKGVAYQCDECMFNLHPECIYLKPNIQYEGHMHLLTLVENMSIRWQCEACGLQALGTFFMHCVECGLDFHVQCRPCPLPLTILHKESGHHLTLRTETLVEDNSDQPLCIICRKKTNPEHPAYYCADFDYHAHVRCVIKEVQVNERGKIKHFSHQHFLFPLENNQGGDNIFCCACEKNVQDNPAYGCNLCQFYLHKSCAELPRERQHPFHRHSLFLPMPYSGEYHKCNACHKQYNGFCYQCRDCNFNLDLDCSLIFPSLKLESVHKHTLTFFKKLYGTPECDHCKFIPPAKVTPLDAYYVRCVVCDFSRHLLCCPLPQTIEHDSHEHSLTLKGNFIDLFDGSDDEEYCCDVCEIRRDARECVYHCEECNFVVDLNECLFSEIMQFLEGKQKGVHGQGIIVSRKITRKVKGITYKDIIDSLTEEERKIMEPFTTEEVEKIIKKGNPSDIFEELGKMDWTAKFRISQELCLDDDHFWSKAKKVGKLESIYEELVDVGDYKICGKLAPVLHNLLKKYGDIGACCPLAQRLKTIPLTKLCVIMQEMKDTMVIHIEKDLIILWWFHLKLIQRAGFGVDFALDHIKRVVRVRFQIDGESSIPSNPFYPIHKKIADHYKKIDKLTKLIEEQKKLAQLTLSGFASGSAMSKAKQSNETLKLLWNNAAAGLLDDIPEM